MHAFRRKDVPVYLAGAAAVCTVVSIAAFEILMGLVIVALVATRQQWRIPRIWIPFSVFFLGTAVSLLASGHIRQGLPQIKKFYVYLMVVLVTSAVRTFTQVRWIALGWTLAASLSAAWALNQFYNKYEDAKDAHEDFYRAYIGDRITGFMGHWMTFSAHMMIALLVIGAIVFFSIDRRWIGALAGAGALISVALLAAETRSVWLAAIVGGMYLIWFWKRWALIAVPVIVAIVVLINPFEIGDRVLSVVRPHGTLDSNAHRAMCRAIGWEMIKAHPLLGVGPEQVGPQHLQYLPPGTQLPLPIGYYGHLHNMYIHYSAERGIPTMLALLWMLAWALADFARALRRLPAGSPARWILHAAIAVMIAILVGGYEELNLGDSEVLAMFLAVVGCGYIAVYEVEQTCKT